MDYGGNRHGFLAFSEIHPDYYQIPVADREALMAEEKAYAESLKAEEEDEEKPKRAVRSRSRAKARMSQAMMRRHSDARRRRPEMSRAWKPLIWVTTTKRARRR